MLGRIIEYFLKSCIYKKLGISEMKQLKFFFNFQQSVFFIFLKLWTPVIIFYFWLIDLWRKHSFLPQKNIRGGGGVRVFEIWTTRGGVVMKKLLRNRGGGSSYKEGVSKLFHQFSFRKACFHYYWIFCLVNIHACCNQ